jgi:hypothetical protein
MFALREKQCLARCEKNIDLSQLTPNNKNSQSIIIARQIILGFFLKIWRVKICPISGSDMQHILSHVNCCVECSMSITLTTFGPQYVPIIQ